MLHFDRSARVFRQCDEFAAHGVSLIRRTLHLCCRGLRFPLAVWERGAQQQRCSNWIPGNDSRMLHDLSWSHRRRNPSVRSVKGLGVLSKIGLSAALWTCGNHTRLVVTYGYVTCATRIELARPIHFRYGL